MLRDEPEADETGNDGKEGGQDEADLVHLQSQVAIDDQRFVGAFVMLDIKAFRWHGGAY